MDLAVANLPEGGIFGTQPKPWPSVFPTIHAANGPPGSSA